jgi:hypothetical protein
MPANRMSAERQRSECTRVRLACRLFPGPYIEAYTHRGSFIEVLSTYTGCPRKKCNNLVFDITF